MLMSVPSRIKVPAITNIVAFGDGCFSFCINAKRKISVIPQIVLRTVVQHAAPD